jgi:hypothetical protein
MSDEKQKWSSAAVGEIANLLFTHYKAATEQTEIVLRFSGEEMLRLDRRAFRQFVSERLNAAGNSLMAEWERWHREETSRDA